MMKTPTLKLKSPVQEDTEALGRSEHSARPRPTSRKSGLFETSLDFLPDPKLASPDESSAMPP